MKYKPLCVAISLAVLLTAAACSHNPSNETKPVSTSSPTVTPTPTMVVMSLEEAGQYYLENIAISNSAAEEYSKAYYSGDVIATTQAAQKLADAYVEVSNKFRAVVWPEETAKYMPALIRQMETSRAYFVRVAAQNSMAGIDGLVGEDSDPSIAKAVRQSLQLPEVKKSLGELTVGSISRSGNTVTVMVTNNLSVPVYDIGAAVSLLDVNGNHVASEYAWMQGEVQAGATASLTVWISDDELAQAVSATSSSVTFMQSADTFEAQEVAVDAGTFPL